MKKMAQQASSTIQKIVFEPIGHIETIWRQKTGTPRQSLLIPNAKGKLRLTIAAAQNQTGNSCHYVDGLEDFSHLWLFWVFHKNTGVEEAIASEESLLLNKPKIRAPRLEGKKVGALSCRSPYRPNPLGMSVVKLDRIELIEETMDAVLHMSGVDLVNGTPIIDIKPYIPDYDCLLAPQHHVTTANWMNEMRAQWPIHTVTFSDQALENLNKFMHKSIFYTDIEQVKQVMAQTIQLDPRSNYRKTKKSKELFGVSVDVFNMIVGVDDEKGTAEIVDVEDWSEGAPSKEDLKQRDTHWVK
jgi:tRNA-Thr(GGU) m(6)t(6)A37 methyltransferase TsaA